MFLPAHQPTARPAGSGPARAGLREGTRVGPWQVERLLGAGAFAAVHRVRHARLGSCFALKSLDPEALARQPLLGELLVAEARTTAALRHPNVVEVVDLGEGPQGPWYVMEQVPGASLARLLARRGRLDVPRALHIGRAVASGLGAAAERGVVHLDLKPGNLLVTPGQRVKLIDFGLAKRLEELSSGLASTTGTPAYMAPEQVGRGRRVDARADMYALGATLYHATSGRPPFEGRSARLLARRKAEEFVPRPSGWLPDYPADVEAFLLELLAARPEHRPTHWSEVLRRIDELSGRPSPAVERRAA